MFYLPGQCVASILQDKLSKSKSIEDRHISLGYGLLPLGEEDVRVVIPGTLIQHSAQAFSILAGNQKYYPSVGDVIVGVVIEKYPETVLVDMKAAKHASLSLYEFEGSSKRNKPDLKIGDTILARVTLAYKEMEPELSCLPLVRHSEKDFLGKLSTDEGGLLLDISPRFYQYLMLEQCPLLIRCRQHVGAFEIFIGKNGRIWIRCGPAVKKGGNHVPSGVLQLKNILEKANRKIKLNLELLDIDECFK